MVKIDEGILRFIKVTFGIMMFTLIFMSMSSIFSLFTDTLRSMGETINEAAKEGLEKIEARESMEAEMPKVAEAKEPANRVIEEPIIAPPPRVVETPAPIEPVKQVEPVVKEPRKKIPTYQLFGVIALLTTMLGYVIYQSRRLYKEFKKLSKHPLRFSRSGKVYGDIDRYLREF